MGLLLEARAVTFDLDRRMLYFYRGKKSRITRLRIILSQISGGASGGTPAGLHRGERETQKTKPLAGKDVTSILEETGAGEVRNFLSQQEDEGGAVKLPYSERDIKRLGFSISEVEELEKVRRKFSLKYPGPIGVHELQNCLRYFGYPASPNIIYQAWDALRESKEPSRGGNGNNNINPVNTTTSAGGVPDSNANPSGVSDNATGAGPTIGGVANNKNGPSSSLGGGGPSCAEDDRKSKKNLKLTGIEYLEFFKTFQDQDLQFVKWVFDVASAPTFGISGSISQSRRGSARRGSQAGRRGSTGGAATTPSPRRRSSIRSSFAMSAFGGVDRADAAGIRRGQNRPQSRGNNLTTCSDPPCVDNPCMSSCICCSTKPKINCPD